MTKPQMSEQIAVRRHDEEYALGYWLDVEEKTAAYMPTLKTLEEGIEQAVRQGRLEEELEQAAVTGNFEQLFGLAKAAQKAAERLLTGKNIPEERQLSSYRLLQAEAKQQWRELKDYALRMGSKSESIRYAINPLPADAGKIVESRLKR